MVRRDGLRNLDAQLELAFSWQVVQSVISVEACSVTRLAKGGDALWASQRRQVQGAPGRPGPVVKGSRDVPKRIGQ
jgi:hypothetical protein